jgi:hypothetical protein
VVQVQVEREWYRLRGWYMLRERYRLRGMVQIEGVVQVEGGRYRLRVLTEKFKVSTFLRAARKLATFQDRTLKWGTVGVGGLIDSLYTSPTNKQKRQLH